MTVTLSSARRLEPVRTLQRRLQETGRTEGTAIEPSSLEMVGTLEAA